VDVVETLSAKLATVGQSGGGSEWSSATLLHADVDGTIWLKSYLQGRPEVRCVFDKMLLVGDQPEEDLEDELGPDEGETPATAKGVIVDDTVFHSCVQVGSSGSEPGADLMSLRVLRVRPPPAEDIAAMRYRVSADGDSGDTGDQQKAGNIRLPFVVSTRFVPLPDKQGAKAGDIRLFQAEVRLDAVFPDEHDAEEVCVRVCLPPSAVSCTCHADNAQRAGGGVEGESACIGDASVPSACARSGGGGGDGTKAAFWRMSSVRGGARCVMRLTVGVPRDGAEDLPSAIGPISLQFDLPMLQCSRVVLKHVRVYDNGKANETAHRWLRYASQSASFECRPG
jgi:hypothetical protein